MKSKCYKCGSPDNLSPYALRSECIGPCVYNKEYSFEFDAFVVHSKGFYADKVTITGTVNAKDVKEAELLSLRKAEFKLGAMGLSYSDGGLEVKLDEVTRI